MDIWFDLKLGKRWQDDNRILHEEVYASRRGHLIFDTLQDFEKELVKLMKTTYKQIMEEYNATNHSKTHRHIRRKSNQTSNHSWEIK